MFTTDNGYRSKCCKAPIRVGRKKVKKLRQEVMVWICCACKTKDVDIITREEALQKEKPVEWWEEGSDAGYSE